jgi:hypothetical protein
MSSGSSLFSFFPQDGEPTATDFATLDTRNAHLVLDFDASTSERTVFKHFVPRHYTNGGITFTFALGGTTATTGSIVLRSEIERINSTSTGSHDIDSDSFDTGVLVTATISDTSGQLRYIEVAHSATQLDSVASAGGEFIRQRFTRVATATGDSMSGDMEFWGGEARET